MAGHIKNHDRMYDCTYCSHYVVRILFSDTCCWNHLINDSWETSAANGSCRNKDINSAIVNRYHFAFWELSDICDFTLNERTTHKKLYAHISRIFYCSCWYTKIYDFLSNQNRVPSIIVCQNESFYGKTSWLIVLKEKCCWNDLMLKGGGKRRRTDRKHLQNQRGWCLLHFSISNATYCWWSYCYCPEMKMLKYPCQGTHTTLCYVCECNTVCTMSMKKELCHFSSSSSRMTTIVPYFLRKMKTFV